MVVYGIEHVFLHANAGRHFVALTYRLRRGTEVHNKHASCFLVEVAGTWFLLTAGHWIKHEEHGLERLLSDGYALDKIQLVDAFAGHTGSPLPFNFALCDWVAIYDDADGIDFAALPVHSFHRRGLESVGVSAIELHAVGPAEFVDDSQLALVGVPAESFKKAGTETEMKLLLVPLTAYAGYDLEAKGNSVLASMPPNPAEKVHRVENIAGMSGCPIFRIVTKVGHAKKYWVVGMQSGWYPDSRVIRFCPIDGFILVLEEAARMNRPGIR